MDSGRPYFDPSSSHGGNMLFLGTETSGFRGQTLMMSMGESPSPKKRPFFTTSSEELYDDEYYDEQLPEKKRRLTPDQVVMLEKSFEEENKLEPERKTQLAKKLGLQPRQVAVWFQNRRARWKTKNLERDYDLLKSAYDSLLANYDNVTMENDRLKSEVVLLSETLQAREVNGPINSGPSSDPNVADPFPEDPGQQLNTRAEDLLSSGSTVGSAVVNEEVNPQLVDSGDSYIPGYPPPCVGPINVAVPSHEDDCSGDGRTGYLCNMFGVAGAEDPNQGIEGWSWIWS